jgi:hypothetical protein
MQAIADILLSLYILNLGIAFGAGLYEIRIMLPQWFIKTSENGFQLNNNVMNEADTGRKFWGMVTTLPLTLLTITNIVLALQADGQKYEWWLASTLIILVERIATFTFFIPTAILLMQKDTLPTNKISNKITLWVQMNYLRNGLTLLGWLAALKVLSLSKV